MGRPAEIYDLVWEYLESQDWDRFMSLFGPDPEMKFQDGTFRGREPTLRYFQKVMEMFPDIRHRIEAVVEAGDGRSMAGWVTAEATGTGSRPLFGNDINVSGKRMYFEAVDFLFIEDDAIKAWWAMLDVFSHVRELGIELQVKA